MQNVEREFSDNIIEISLSPEQKTAMDISAQISRIKSKIVSLDTPLDGMYEQDHSIFIANVNDSIYISVFDLGLRGIGSDRAVIYTKRNDSWGIHPLFKQFSEVLSIGVHTDIASMERAQEYLDKYREIDSNPNWGKEDFETRYYFNDKGEYLKTSRMSWGIEDSRENVAGQGEISRVLSDINPGDFEMAGWCVQQINKRLEAYLQSYYS